MARKPRKRRSASQVAGDTQTNRSEVHLTPKGRLPSECGEASPCPPAGRETRSSCGTRPGAPPRDPAPPLLGASPEEPGAGEAGWRVYSPDAQEGCRRDARAHPQRSRSAQGTLKGCCPPGITGVMLCPGVPAAGSGVSDLGGGRTVVAPTLQPRALGTRSSTPPGPGGSRVCATSTWPRAGPRCARLRVSETPPHGGRGLQRVSDASGQPRAQWPSRPAHPNPAADRKHVALGHAGPGQLQLPEVLSSRKGLGQVQCRRVEPWWLSRLSSPRPSQGSPDTGARHA